MSTPPKIERETIVPFEFRSQMKDVGHVRMSLKLLRRTAEVSTAIKQARARMLGGFKPINPADDLHFDIMATLANAVEPQPNPTPNDPGAWVNDILDPEMWHAIYARWMEYQDSFYVKPAGSDAAPGSV